MLQSQIACPCSFSPLHKKFLTRLVNGQPLFPRRLDETLILTSMLRNAGILQALHFVVGTWLGSRDQQAEVAVKWCLLRTVHRSSSSFQVQVVSGQFCLKNEKDTRRLNDRQRGQCFRLWSNIGLGSFPPSLWRAGRIPSMRGQRLSQCGSVGMFHLSSSTAIDALLSQIQPLVLMLSQNTGVERLYLAFSLSAESREAQAHRRGFHPGSKTVSSSRDENNSRSRE